MKEYSQFHRELTGGARTRDRLGQEERWGGWRFHCTSEPSVWHSSPQLVTHVALEEMDHIHPGTVAIPLCDLTGESFSITVYKGST